MSALAAALDAIADPGQAPDPHNVVKRVPPFPHPSPEALNVRVQRQRRYLILAGGAAGSLLILAVFGFSWWFVGAAAATWFAFKNAPCDEGKLDEAKRQADAAWTNDRCLSAGRSSRR